MNKFKLFGIATFAMVLVSQTSCSRHPARDEREASWATPVASANLKNLYRVDEGLYRSDQPSRAGFRELWDMGVREVLNLRSMRNDDHKARGLGLRLHHIRMNAGNPETEEFVEALRIIRDRRGPLVIHCWHGSDRTGIVTALYRMVFQDWTRERAIDELKYGGYGYHPVFGDIITYLETVDIEQLRAAL